MKRTLFISSVLLSAVIVLFAFWIIGAMIQKKQAPLDISDGRPLVLVSVAPFSTMVAQIAGDSVDIVTVIPAHVDPHNWEPTYNDMDKLKNATIWFTAGMGFEHPLEKKLLEVNPHLIIENLNDHVETVEVKEDDHHHHHEPVDVHTWLSPKLDIVIAGYLCDVLSQLFPSNAPAYKENLLDLVDKLGEIDKAARQSLVPFAGELLVTTHGAYTYYCKEFGLEQVVIEPSEGKEPRMREITQLVKRLKSDKRRIAAILVQPQHANKSTTLIAKELNITPYTLDPYSPAYMDTIQRLTTIILTGNGRGSS